MASDALNERKRIILRAVTDDYISSAEPVGSRTITRKYNLGLSPATIRNEMADLEEEGYLQQPHTSAGRIPSDQGYRYYVDSLLAHKTLSPQDLIEIHREMERRQLGMEELLKQAGKILAQLTRYPAMISTPQQQKVSFRHVQLVPLNEKNVMVVVITDTGMVENQILPPEVEWTYDELDRISKWINHRLRGITLEELTGKRWNEIRLDIELEDHNFHHALGILLDALANSRRDRVYLDGAANILEQPEFREVERFKPLMGLFETEDVLRKLLKPNDKGVTIRIGHENEQEAIKECSVVTTNYRIGDNAVGVVGVLGPTRMDYGKILAIVEYMSKYLGKLLTDVGNK